MSKEDESRRAFLKGAAAGAGAVATAAFVPDAAAKQTAAAHADTANAAADGAGCAADETGNSVAAGR